MSLGSFSDMAARQQSAAAFELELTSLLRRIEAEIARKRSITPGSARQLHELRVSAERWLVSLEVRKSPAMEPGM